MSEEQARLAWRRKFPTFADHPSPWDAFIAGRESAVVAMREERDPGMVVVRRVPDKFRAAREIAESVANSYRAPDKSHTEISKALYLMIDLALAAEVAAAYEWSGEAVE